MDVYRVGVSLILTHNIATALATIGPQLLGIHATVGNINQNFGRWATALGGIAGILGAGAIAKGLADIAKHGGAVNHELEMMKIAGMSVAEVQSASSQAMKTSTDNLTTSYSENMKHLRELRYAFGDTQTAEKHLTEVTQANTILNAVLAKHNVIGQNDQVWELVKSLEMKGLTFDSKEFSSYLNAMTKVVEATGGKVTPAMFQSAFKYGRVSTLGWDESFIGGALPRLMQDWATGSGTGGTGSGGPGNALMTGFRQMVSGIMSKASAEMMSELGFGTMVPKNKFRPAHLNVNEELTKLFIKNPYEAIQSMMPKIMEKYGRDPDVLIKKLGELFPVRTFGAAATQFALQGRAFLGENSPYEKDIRLQRGAMGGAGFGEIIKNDYPTVVEAFTKQWKNLLEVVGSPLMEPGGPVLSAMSGITSAFNSMSTFAKANPEAIKIIAEALVAFGVALAALGVIALASLAAVPIAIAAIAAAITAFVAINWDLFKSIVNVIIDGVTTLVNFLSSIPDKLGSILKGLGSTWAPATQTPKAGPGPYGPGYGFQPQRYNPSGTAPDPMKMPMNFTPGIDKQEKQQFAFSLDVDGNKLAQTIIDKMTEMSTFSNGAPSPNGLAMWTGGDHNFGTV